MSCRGAHKDTTWSCCSGCRAALAAVLHPFSQVKNQWGHYQKLLGRLHGSWFMFALTLPSISLSLRPSSLYPHAPADAPRFGRTSASDGYQCWRYKGYHFHTTSIFGMRKMLVEYYYISVWQCAVSNMLVPTGTRIDVQVCYATIGAKMIRNDTYKHTKRLQMCTIEVLFHDIWKNEPRTSKPNALPHAQSTTSCKDLLRQWDWC